MKIIAIETLRPDVQRNVCFVRLYTDAGLIGLGESFYAAASVETYLHDHVAPTLFGLPDASPEPASRALRPYVGYQGSGVETRAISAVDVALWDLLGHQSGLPITSLLGGASRSRVRTYNTCAGTRYMSSTARQESSNWGLDSGAGHRYEDLSAFLADPRRLARDLVSQGLTAMKVWPFDRAAERTGGQDISARELDEGVDRLAEIRDECGAEIDILVELHGLWSPRGAAAICRAIEPLSPYWVEDPVKPESIDALATLRALTDVRIATGETATGRRGFLPLLQQRLVDVVTLDIGWAGGLSEAVRIASLADTFGVPIAPHDCTGPVSLGVAVQLVCSQPNGLIQESARAFLHSWYADLAEGYPVPIDGHLEPSGRPGHGVRLLDDIAARSDVAVRRSDANAL